VVLQTLLFSVLVNAWYRHPSRWWNRAMAGALVAIAVMCTLGVLAALYPHAFERETHPGT
jgi:membrane protein YdbS with pleckstrin-like domain